MLPVCQCVFHKADILVEDDAKGLTADAHTPDHACLRSAREVLLLQCNYRFIK